jgi:polyisoprenyl-phosphate glycosyltransferase
VLALMGEYLGRLYNQAKNRPLYIVQEIAGRDGEEPARLGVIASCVGPAPMKGKGQKRRKNEVGDDGPPGRSA